MQSNLEKKLDIIKNKMDILTDLPSNDFVDDCTVFEVILSDRYENVYDNFWVYFKKKYDLPEIKDFFENSYVLLSTIFVECIRPFFLRLDLLPDYNNKYEKMTYKHKAKWSVNMWISSNWITVISIFLMFFSFMYSSKLEDKNTFDYDVSMSIGTGFLIASIISFINAAHRRRLRKKAYEINTIIYQFKKIKESYEKMDKIIKQGTKRRNDFVTNFCVMNNSLNDFIKITKKFTSVQTIDTYHRLINFEKEIFDYSRKVVQKPFEKYLMDNTSSDEIGKLQKYTIQLGYWLSDLELEISALKIYYDNDITKMEDKSL